MNETIKNTLVDLVVKHIKDNRYKNTKKNRNEKHRANRKSNIKHIIPTGISLIVNAALKQSKSNKKKAAQEKSELEETTEESKSKSGEQPGGYGTIKPYAGMSPYVQYADYGKIWKHIGTFSTNGAYGTSFERESLRSSVSESSGILVGMEVIEKAQKHFKYFVRGDIMGDIGYVPPFGTGIDSKDWEKYRMMTQMSIYMPLLKLMRSMV